jgi:Rad52/22 family double-strand break repair protein
MALTDTQIRQLRAKLDAKQRAGDITIVREGSGTGEGNALTAGQAHELALKRAETDATKRALATFGNPFGLALYDRERVGVRRARGAPAKGPWVLQSTSGSDVISFDKPSEFASALRKLMSEAQDIEILFAIWEQNVETVRALNRSLRQDSLRRSGLAPQLAAHLKQCAIALVKPENRSNGQSKDRQSSPGPRVSTVARPKIDKSVLTISEPKRHRSREHLPS